MVEGKRELLKGLKKEESEFNKKCTAMEDEIQSKETLVKNKMELQENLDLKMLGLELSEELHRKKCDE